MSGKSRRREGAGDSVDKAQSNREDSKRRDGSRELNVFFLFFWNLI